MEAVNGVILAVISNTSQTLETQSLLVSFDGIILLVTFGFRPVIFLARFISLMSSEMTSFFGEHFFSATCMLLPSSGYDSGGL